MEAEAEAEAEEWEASLKRDESFSKLTCTGVKREGSLTGLVGGVDIRSSGWLLPTNGWRICLPKGWVGASVNESF